MRIRMTLAALGAVLAAALALVSPSLAPAAAGVDAWAPAATATIHPGVQMDSPRGQCTANFVFTNGADVLLGFAAHCVGTGAATDTERVRRRQPRRSERPSRSRVRRSRAASSTARGSPCRPPARPTSNACDYNDFALVRIAAADVASVNPSIPHWGGPTG